MTPSPCIGRCRIDPGVRLCVGCGRSGAEVAAWRDADPAELARVWADLPRRRAALGIKLYRRGWSPEETRVFVGKTLTTRQGSWTVGDWGASARYAAAEHGLIAPIAGPGLTVRVSTGLLAIRFTLDDRVRVLAVASGGGKSSPARERIILAVPKTRDLPEPATTLTSLGSDADEIDPIDRPTWYFDLGIGRSATRVGLRTHDSDIAAELDRRVGSDWSSLLADLGERLGRSTKTAWVVETPLVRIEVEARAAHDPAGPFRLDPAALALDRATPPDLDIPPTFVPCAIFDPAPERPGPAWLRWLTGRG